MNLNDTPYNYDSKPMQPHEPPEDHTWAERTRLRCEREATRSMGSCWRDYVVDATELDVSEIIDACEAVMAWRKDGYKMDEKPEAECFMFISLLLDRAEHELYRRLLKREGVEE